MVQQSAAKEILGVGWSFPVRIDRRRNGESVAPGRGHGGVTLARYEEDIEQSVRIILATSPGERKMRPSFGCEIHSLVFMPANYTTFGLMRHYVEEALAMWEPRIDVHGVQVEDVNSDGTVDILITYDVRTTKDRRTLVYPFYTMGEG